MPLLPPVGRMSGASREQTDGVVSSEIEVKSRFSSISYCLGTSIPIMFSSQLFDEGVLADSPVTIPDGLVLRPLNALDYHKGLK